MKIEPAALARWQSDVCAFAEEVLVVRDPGTRHFAPLRLYPEQRQWLEEATRRDAAGHFVRQVAVASWPKRCGKSLCVAIVALWRAMTRPGERVVILANSRQQAQSNILDMVGAFLKRSPLLKGEATLHPDNISIGKLGSTVVCLPSNAATVQGLAIDVLCSDELHAAGSTEAFTFASQQTEATDAQVLIASQAGAPVASNPLWRLWADGEPEEHVFFSYRTDTFTAWAQARAEKAKSELLDGEWQYLWANAWGATGLRMFPAEALQDCELRYSEPTTAGEWEALLEAWGWDRGAVTIGAALDRAGVGTTGDRSVWTVVACYAVGDQRLFRVVRCKVLPTGSEAEVLAEARATERVFGRPLATLLESYGCSDLVGKVPGATLEAPTMQRQQGLFGRLHRAVGEGRLGYSAEAGGGLLKSELVAFSYDVQKGEGATRYGTQRGAHDDTVYSLAWGCEAADGPERPPLQVFFGSAAGTGTPADPELSPGERVALELASRRWGEY